MKALLCLFIAHSLLCSQSRASALDRIAQASNQLNSVLQDLTPVAKNCENSLLAESTQTDSRQWDSSDLLLVHPIQSSKEYEQVFHNPPAQEPTEKKPFYVSMIFQNDKRLGYEQLTKHKSDDAGRTHGLELHLGSQDAEGTTRDLSLSSYLTTSRIRNVFDENGHPVRFSKSGERLNYSHSANSVDFYTDQQNQIVPEDQITKKPQNFNEINSLLFLQDNVKKGDTVYYKAGIGAIMIVSNRPSALGAAAQQQRWHQAAGKTVYTNIGDGEKDRYGVTALGALGLQKEMEARSIDVGIGMLNYRIKGSLEAGAQVDTLHNDRAWGKASAGIGLGAEVRRGERRFESTVSVERSRSSLEELELTLNGKDCSLLVSYQLYSNDVKKYAPRREGTMKMGAKCYF